MVKQKMDLRYLLNLVNSATQKNYDGSQTSVLTALGLQIHDYLEHQQAYVLEGEIGAISQVREIKFVLGCHPRGLVWQMVVAKWNSLSGQSYGQPRSFNSLQPPA